MPAFGANDIENRSFPTSFRGFDQDAVREYLEELAEAVRSLEDEAAYLRTAAASSDPVELNEETVTRFLGEETAGVLIAAREAAAEIRAKAEDSVARLLREASDDANRIRADAEETVRERVQGAEDDANRIRAAASADADATRADVDRLRSDAEEVAAAVRLAADDHARTARLDAERDADRIRAEAAELAAADTEAAKREGRSLLDEAKRLRQRVLDDLAVKRKAARVQLEQLRGGRDRLLEAYEVVRRTLDEATRELEFSVDAARTAADLAARRAEIEPTPGAEDVEIELAAMAALDVEDEIDITDAAIEVVEIVEIVEIVEVVDDDAEAEDEAEDEIAFDDAPLVVEDDAGDADGADAVAEGLVDRAVDAIFARLRAGAPDAPADETEDEPEADGEDEPDADAEPMSLEARTAADESLLERRDATTDAVEHQLAKRLKRVLADEQNEVLDRLRRDPSGGSRAILPSPDEQTARYAERATDDLVEAATAGRAFFGAANGAGGDVAVDDLATELASAISGQIRHRVEHTLLDLAGDEDAMADGIRACYREWKTQRLGDAARHFVLAAFTRGVYESVAPQTCLRWLVDDGGSPCPDAEDNALAGLTVRGEPFPTGHQLPPAHPGCRCLVVPEHR